MIAPAAKAIRMLAAPPDQWPSEKMTSGIVTDQKRPTPRICKRSTRRTITRRAAALAQISVSFRIADATVISGTKNTNAWRISTIANNARDRLTQVTRETLAAIDGLSVMRKDDASMLSLSMAFH